MFGCGKSVFTLILIYIGFQKGLTADNIVIVLHSDKEVVRKRQITAEQILNQLNISVNIWHGM